MDVLAVVGHLERGFLPVHRRGLGDRLLEHRLAGPHPVLVAAQRIDLAVVREETKRLRETPFGQRVRRKPLVEQADGRFEPRVAQVRVAFGSWRGVRPLLSKRPS